MKEIPSFPRVPLAVDDAMQSHIDFLDEKVNELWVNHGLKYRIWTLERLVPQGSFEVDAAYPVDDDIIIFGRYIGLGPEMLVRSLRGKEETIPETINVTVTDSYERIDPDAPLQKFRHIVSNLMFWEGSRFHSGLHRDFVRWYDALVLRGIDQNIKDAEGIVEPIEFLSRQEYSGNHVPGQQGEPYNIVSERRYPMTHDQQIGAVDVLAKHEAIKRGGNAILPLEDGRYVALRR